MDITSNREDRRKQKDLLKTYFDDYNPVMHDAFVMRYNVELERRKLNQYLLNRGLSTNAENPVNTEN